MKHTSLAFGALLLAAPAPALACGGLFCNNSQPVVQSAERILFAQVGEKVEMHVRIAYSGPPQAFGWLLPVPRDVETGLSSEQLFAQLDQSFGPRFVLNTIFDDGCEIFAPQAAGGGDAAGAPDAASSGGPRVTVLSREAVGPYDRVILDADDVQVLRAWLDENEYQIPEGSDATLQPYIDAGAVFVAIKLLPGADVQDIVPLYLTFGSEAPAIPILPTAVAATPDMGIIVHVLGSARAIPKNYRHVQINEAAIDWLSGGQNYTDVVSQAADEAGGRAFATDFAGPHQGQLSLTQLDSAGFSAVRTQGELLDYIFNTIGFIDLDLSRVLAEFLTPPDGVDVQTFLQCLQCYDYPREAAVDGEALGARVESEVTEPHRRIQGLFDHRPYLTRLYSTMSADEMREDPIFSFSDELPDVPSTRTADAYTACSPDQGTYVREIVTSRGQSIPLGVGAQNPNIIRRANGETTEQGDEPGAAVVEQLLEAGDPEVIDAVDAGTGPRGNVVARDDSGCDCSSTGTSDAPVVMGLAAGALALLRRRRR